MSDFLRRNLILERLMRTGSGDVDDVTEIEARYSISDVGAVYLARTGNPALGDAVALFFRPTGISYDGRSDVIKKIHDRNYDKKYQYRFSLKVRTHGAGAGGLEIFAHERETYRRNPSRISLLVQGTWGPDVDPGTELGSVGWLPREVTKPCRELVYKRTPMAFTAYQTYRGRGDSTPNILLCFIMWKVPNADNVADHIATLYPVLAERTNLAFWNNQELRRAWVPSPEACLDDEFGTL